MSGSTLNLLFALNYRILQELASRFLKEEFDCSRLPSPPGLPSPATPFSTATSSLTSPTSPAAADDSSMLLFPSLLRLKEGGLLPGGQYRRGQCRGLRT